MRVTGTAADVFICMTGILSAKGRPLPRRMIMEPISLVLFLLIALFAGWLAGQIMGRAMGVVGSLVVGVLGALLGGFLFRLLATSLDVSLRHDLPPYVWSSVVALVGAVVVLLVIRAVEEER